MSKSVWFEADCSLSPYWFEEVPAAHHLATARLDVHYFLGSRTFIPRASGSDIIYDYIRTDREPFYSMIGGRVAAIHQVTVSPNICALDTPLTTLVKDTDEYQIYLEPMNGQQDMEMAFREQYDEASRTVEHERISDRWGLTSGVFDGKIESWCYEQNDDAIFLLVTADSSTLVETDEGDHQTELKDLESDSVEITCSFQRIDTANRRVRSVERRSSLC